MRFTLILLLALAASDCVAGDEDICKSSMLHKGVGADALADHLGQFAKDGMAKVGTEIWYSVYKQTSADLSCAKIVEAVAEAENLYKGFVTNANCNYQLLTFNVPGFAKGKNFQTNPAPMWDPWRGEGYSQLINEARQGQVPVRKDINILMNGSERQIKLKEEGFAYRYDKEGRPVEEIHYLKNKGEYEISCAKINGHNLERIYQINAITPTVKTFMSKGICARTDCTTALEAHYAENRKMVEKLGPSMNAAEIETSPTDPCDRMRAVLENSRFHCLSREDARLFSTKRCGNKSSFAPKECTKAQIELDETSK